MTNTPTHTNRSTFATADAERRAIEHIKPLNLEKPSPQRIGTVFQTAAGDRREPPFGLWDSIATQGLEPVVASHMIPETLRLGGEWMMLHNPLSAGSLDYGDAMHVCARYQLREAGYFRAASKKGIINAGKRIRDAGLDAYWYGGTGKKDPRFTQAAEHGDGPCVLEYICECFEPVVEGGWKVIVDTSADARNGSIMAEFIRWLDSKDAYGGYEPRAQKGSIHERRPAPCWTLQSFDPDGTPNDFIRSDPDEYPDSGAASHRHTATEVVAWPIDRKEKGEWVKSMSSEVIAYLYAAGYSLGLERAWNLTATEIRERAAEVREAQA